MMAQPNFDKLFAAMSPPVYMVDLSRLLKLLYNAPICDEVPKMFAVDGDKFRMAFFTEKAECYQAMRQNNADAWIDFLANLDSEHTKMAVAYINQFEC